MTETEHKEVLAWNDDLGRLVVVNQLSLDNEIRLPIKTESTPIVVEKETITNKAVTPQPVEDADLDAQFDGDSLDFDGFDEDEDEDYW